MRRSMLDVYGMIDEVQLKRNIGAISDALISTVYQSKIDDENLAVSSEAVIAWTRQLASEPRHAGNVTSRMNNDIVKVDFLNLKKSLSLVFSISRNSARMEKWPDVLYALSWPYTIRMRRSCRNFWCGRLCLTFTWVPLCLAT